MARFIGTAGDDRLTGTSGRDTLYGRAGTDVLTAGAGNDVLYGEAGDDTLWGQDGDDRAHDAQRLPCPDGRPGRNHPRRDGEWRQVQSANLTRCAAQSFQAHGRSSP